MKEKKNTPLSSLPVLKRQRHRVEQLLEGRQAHVFVRGRQLELGPDLGGDLVRGVDVRVVGEVDRPLGALEAAVVVVPLLLPPRVAAAAPRVVAAPVAVFSSSSPVSSS